MIPTQSEQTNSLWQTLHLPSHWPVQTDLLQWCNDMSPGAATALVIGGIIYLLFGWHMFKALVTLNAAFFGAYIGSRFGQAAGSSFIGACIGAFFVAAITFPVMKYAVAVMGGTFGALLGATAWHAGQLPGNLAWSGALIGLITFGLLSFIVFKGSIMMYTSLQGAVMLIFGILGLVYKYQDIAPKVTSNLTVQPFLLPLAIFIPTVLGLIYQQTQFSAPATAKKK